MTKDNRYPHLGEVVIATQVRKGQQARRIILLLIVCVALMMTGSGLVMPIFARRLSDFGAGVEALGMMAMGFALAQLIASPFMGTLADQYGRRPWILLALGGSVFTSLGYLYAPSTIYFIALNVADGLLSAGLFPAIMGIVADLIDEKARAQWIGFMMGGFGVGTIFGPLVGGLLYDQWGFALPFIVSAITSAIAFVVAIMVIPETRPLTVRKREVLRQRREVVLSEQKDQSIWSILPKPLYVFGTLVLIDFMAAFAFAFVEPQLIFYMYDQLGWTTTQFGIVVGLYGLVMMLGQIVLGQLSDRFGRKAILIVGTLLNTTFYIGFAFVTSFPLILLISLISGAGKALITPALSAFYLDISDKQHQGKILGIQNSFLSLGGVIGPLAVAFVSGWTNAQGIFMIATALMLISAALGIIFLREPDHSTTETNKIAVSIAKQRDLTAQISLRGLVLAAKETRQRPKVI